MPWAYSKGAPLPVTSYASSAPSTASRCCVAVIAGSPPGDGRRVNAQLVDHFDGLRYVVRPDDVDHGHGVHHDRVARHGGSGDDQHADPVLQKLREAVRN